MLGGTERVRVAADVRVMGRREMRRRERSMVACVSGKVQGEVVKEL